jgi:hypothetical protein
VKEGGSEGGREREGVRQGPKGRNVSSRLVLVGPSSLNIFQEPKISVKKTFRTTCSDVFLVADADVRINDVLSGV